MAKSKTIMQTIKDNPFQAAGALLFVGNLYLASLLFPITRDLDKIVTRVDAIESELNMRQDYVDRFIVVEQEVKEVNRRLQNIEDKLDTIGGLLQR